MQKSERPIKIDFEGKTYSANYYIEKNWLYMRSNWGSKSATLGPGPESIARVLLREVLTDAKRSNTLD